MRPASIFLIIQLSNSRCLPGDTGYSYSIYYSYDSDKKKKKKLTYAVSPYIISVEKYYQ